MRGSVNIYFHIFIHEIKITVEFSVKVIYVVYIIFIRARTLIFLNIIIQISTFAFIYAITIALRRASYDVFDF